MTERRSGWLRAGVPLNDYLFAIRCQIEQPG